MTEYSPVQGCAEELGRFASLQARLKPRFRDVYCDPRAPRTVVVVPGLSVDQLSLLPGVPHQHARRRLVLLSAHDASPITLTKKILERPRLLARIREAIGESGLFRTPGGQPRCYYATDNLPRQAYRRLLPEDLIDIAAEHDLHFDQTLQQGVTFNLIGALSEFGKLGIVSIADSVQHASEAFERTVAVLDQEAGRTSTDPASLEND